MKITIQRFSLSITIVLFSLFLSVFTYYHFTQEEKTAKVILNSLSSTISETSYILSKNITNENMALSQRPLLDRVASNNQFVEAILIHNEHKVILSTDPHYRKIIPANSLYNFKTTAYKELLRREAIENDIKFYQGNKVVILKLLFILDKEEISLYIHKKELLSYMYFGLLPVASLIFIFFLLRHFVVKPLEKLRQYAYYQNNVPKAFMLKELEVIRYSMVQTYQRLDKEKEDLYLMARTDLLSGLANRNALIEYANKTIEYSKRNNKEFAFLFLDLDHFKAINDSLGHNVGDELLKKIASIINEVIRSNDFVARIGGDEFIIILQEYHSILELTNIIDRIQKQLSKTFIIQTNPISINSSIGITFYPKDGKDVEQLMKYADIAMYEAKQQGRARYHFFTEELNKRVQDTISLNKEMLEALANNEYILHYQPKVDLKSGKILGVEALIRWISPKHGLVPPDKFIPLAEENNFIINLGTWVIKEASKQQKIWKDKGLDLRISINVSSKQLLKDDFAKTFLHILKENNVDPGQIDIEITEYMFLDKSDKNYKLLNQLRAKNVTVSLDDFGTGYSSLSYLKEFPIDYLKIDKSFIDDYKNEQGAIFIDTIVKMGQTLNMKIIAEGVEEKEQVDYLKAIGCDQYQGYYFSKPLSVKDFEKAFIKSI